MKLNNTSIALGGGVAIENVLSLIKVNTSLIFGSTFLATSRRFTSE